MKIISWNVNGLRAALKKDFYSFVKKENPDILCLQEIKANKEDVEISLPEHPYLFWNSAKKKGYAGTSIFSKIQPLKVSYGMGINEHDNEGRIICAEFNDYFLVTVYVPNSQRGLTRLGYRSQWDKDFLAYVKKLEKTKPVIICGDLNVAHTDIDLANPKENYNVTAGFTQVEIDGFERMLTSGFVDTFREFDKEPNNYTYWSYMFNARAKNIGWRIDYFLVTSSLHEKVGDSFILPQVMGSDHCPVGIKINN
ncbi:exodeoxyribonuclease III [Candidatus Woesearchaeota archaeon]|nr:exodeoxyribonuclease III [Candidatus Woesearchaeota archaeon]